MNAFGFHQAVGLIGKLNFIFSMSKFWGKLENLEKGNEKEGVV